MSDLHDSREKISLNEVSQETGLVSARRNRQHNLNGSLPNLDYIVASSAADHPIEYLGDGAYAYCHCE